MSSGAVEHGQDMILDRQLRANKEENKTPAGERRPLLSGFSGGRQEYTTTNTASSSTSSLRAKPNYSGSSLASDEANARLEQSNSIRFQVVVWSIGQMDVVQGRVPVTFRATIFWNDEKPDADVGLNLVQEHDIPMGDVSTCSRRAQSTWRMQGRQAAALQEQCETVEQTVPVPPVSILNAATFDTIGAPDITLLEESASGRGRLWRWSCMYRATLLQDSWRVDDFPHDDHEISIKLAVLAHRKPGRQWDRQKWKLALATEEDSQGSISIPHGLVVDHVCIPEFEYDDAEGLRFYFCPISHGMGGATPSGGGTLDDDQERCVNVKLRVFRVSSYYDNSIVPLLGLLNFVAITIATIPNEQFFQRGLLTLNITFVMVGIRMSTDKLLPSVSYEIKLQKILNEYFYCLLCLVLESNLVYHMGFSPVLSPYTEFVDVLASIIVFGHNAWSLTKYYRERNHIRRQLRQGHQERKWALAKEKKERRRKDGLPMDSVRSPKPTTGPSRGPGRV